MDELEKLNGQCMRCQEEAQKNFQTLNTVHVGFVQLDKKFMS